MNAEEERDDKFEIPVGGVYFGDLRRVEPISLDFGADRGKPLDRYYIEKFLQGYARDIKGTVLEFEDATYTKKFGGDRVQRSEVLNLDPNHKGATIVADITHAPGIQSDQFDCIICTQMLFMVYDLKGAMATLYRILKPEGVLLITVPGIAQICPNEGASWNDQWRFTRSSLENLLKENFNKKKVALSFYGNVLVATAMLYGLAMEELTQAEMDHNDDNFEMIVGARAVK